MLNIYRTENKKLVNASYSDSNLWINLFDPTTVEIEEVSNFTDIDISYIEDVLDTEESSRIDFEDNQTLIVINVAVSEDNSRIKFKTIPIGIFITDVAVVTVSSEELPCLKKFSTINNRYIDINKPANFTLQIIYETTAMYLNHLNILGTVTDEIEEQLYSSMEDDLFIDLIKIEKTLVYFSNSLSSNKGVVDKLYRNNYLAFYEQDIALLDDIDIEVVQAIEMAKTRAEIIRSIRDGISSLMSNKLNITMQALAAITIILTIPTMIFSFYGMNINLGDTTSQYSALIILGGTSIVTIIIFLAMRRRKFFK